jgi:tetratricopeptide (TPR) repeat protein
MLRFWLSYTTYWWGIVHRYIGTTHNVPSEFRRAANAFGRAYAIDPTFTRAKLDRAILLSRELGELEPAMQLLDELITPATPHTQLALFNRALIHQQRWDLAACEADLTRYLEMGEQEGTYWETAVRLLASIRQPSPSTEI